MIRYLALSVLPKNVISRVIGILAEIRWPRRVTQFVISQFIRRYGVNTSEAEFPVQQYASLADFFARRLRAGLRPIGAGIVSPVDGTVAEFGRIVDGRVIQAKGIDYSLRNLVGRPELAERFRDGFFVTLYLAPHNYHRIHSPCDALIDEAFLIPGTLWPVNGWSVRTVPQVFVKNERLIVRLRGTDRHILLIAVGAFNVGSIRFSLDELVGNRSRPSDLERWYSPPLQVYKGGEIARFHLGSTVILLFEAGVPAATFRPLRMTEIRMGESLFGQ